MTRLLTCGWETGDLNEAGATTTTVNAVPAVVSTVPTPRAGNYTLKVSVTAQNQAGYKSVGLPARAELWVRAAVFVHGFAGELAIVSLTDLSGSGVASISYSGSDGTFKLRTYSACPGSVLITFGALLASTAAFSQDAWHVLEWHHLITSATTGTSEVWIDGVQGITFSGDVTASGTSGTTIAAIQFGLCSTLGTGTSQYVAIDDIAVNDNLGTINNGRVGDGRVLLLSPTGAGSSADLTRGGADSGANWSQVEEVPPSMTDFVYESVVGRRDLYGVADLPGGSWTINTVEALAYAQGSDVGGPQVAPTLKSGSTTAEGSAATLTTTPTYVRTQWETDPNTTAGWTPTAVNALEVGVTVR